MFSLPAAAGPADLPRDTRLQIVAPDVEPPDGAGWLHEIKHDGHRLLAIRDCDCDQSGRYPAPGCVSPTICEQRDS